MRAKLCLLFHWRVQTEKEVASVGKELLISFIGLSDCTNIQCSGLRHCELGNRRLRNIWRYGKSSCNNGRGNSHRSVNSRVRYQKVFLTIGICNQLTPIFFAFDKVIILLQAEIHKLCVGLFPFSDCWRSLQGREGWFETFKCGKSDLIREV